MKKNIAPKTVLGKWTVGLNILFLIVIITSIILVKGIGVLSFDDLWWDITALIFFVPIIALMIGLVSVIKDKERSVLVYVSIFISICVILFILLHSLFISD